MTGMGVLVAPAAALMACLLGAEMTRTPSEERLELTLVGDSIEKFQLEIWLEKSREFWLEIPYTKKKFKNW